MVFLSVSRVLGRHFTKTERGIASYSQILRVVMGCASSIPQELPYIPPQLPISCLLPTVRANEDPAGTLVRLENMKLVPRNKFDLWRAIGNEGHPPQGMERQEILKIAVLMLRAEKKREDDKYADQESLSPPPYEKVSLPWPKMSHLQAIPEI